MYISLGAASSIQAADSLRAVSVVPHQESAHSQLGSTNPTKQAFILPSKQAFQRVRRNPQARASPTMQQAGLAANTTNPLLSAPASAAPPLAVKSYPTPHFLDARPRLDLQVSGWTIWRNDPGGASLATAGQLGASQAGMRITLPVATIGQSTQLSLNARASAPLGSRAGKEAAIGVVVRRPGALPLEFAIERRFGARKAFALTAATGVNDHPIGRRLSVTGYGQAGVVGLRRRDAFVDGGIQIDRTVHSTDKMRVSSGIGVWGAAQPGLSRLDIGPQATLKVSNLRISGQWRFRTLGEAQPGSGAAIVIGADF